LIRAARLAHELRHADRFGIAATEPEVNFPAVMSRIKQVIATIEPKDSVERYRELGVNCIMGDAVIEDPHHVRVVQGTESQLLSTRSIVIATGARPFIPMIPGLRELQPLTSDSVWELKELPARLLVMGGGPIGCELAQSFARLGSRVTLIDMEGRLLPREDEDVSELLEAAFAAEGIDVRLNHKAVAVEPGLLRAEHDGGIVDLPFDEILVAVGRAANTADLGLDRLGIELNPNGTVRVDEFLRTRCPNIFASGDVVGPYQFTHMASHQAWYAAVNALFGRFWKFRADYKVVPWATYSDPEVARVGLSETEALAQGVAFETVRYPLDDLDRAITEGATQGWVKVLVKPGSDRILGAQIVGAEAGELIAEFVLAMTQGLGLKKIMGTIHIYPTRMEAVKFAAGAWRRAHAPERVLGWVGRLHSLLR
jgi:pyruvate/2-oxoglutarate dehydrogenase complex dihydrolipoamide dehydrogenase (E3) component